MKAPKLLLALIAPALLLAAPVDARPTRRRPPPPEQYGPPPPPTPYDVCESAIADAERGLPAKLLPAISRVESGRFDTKAGRVRPWPWTINVEGVGSFFETKEEAISTVAALQAKGVRSIDVGCMQVNLMHHPKAFASLDEAFDPPKNTAYAARFLTSLHGMLKDWNLATAAYHSMDPERGEDYQRRVFGQVMTPMGAVRKFASAEVGAFGAWAPQSRVFAALPPTTLAYGAFSVPSAGPSVLVKPIGTTLRRK